MDDAKIDTAIDTDSVRPAIEANVCKHCERKITRKITPSGSIGPWIDGDDEIECPQNADNCPLCRGSGYEEVDCPYCGGTGESGEGKADDGEPIDCSACKGNGVDYEYCDECDGSGEWAGTHEPR